MQQSRQNVIPIGGNLLVFGKKITINKHKYTKCFRDGHDPANGETKQIDKMQKSIVSLTVIVTLYNNSEYIVECLNSIEGQRSDDIEVIIMNDGSTDRPFDLIQPFLERNGNWRYYSHDNRGVGFSRNRAVLLANGEYIGFLDSDDYVSPTYFIDLLSIARSKNACVVLSNFSKFDETHVQRTINRQDKYNMLGDLTLDDRIQHIFGGQMYGMACASIFRRALLIEDNLLFPANTHHEDLFVLPKIYTKAHIVAHTDTAGYFWRMRSESESHSISSRHIINTLHALTEKQDYLRSIGKYEMVKRRFTNHCVAYLNGLLRKINATEPGGLKDYLLDLLRSASEMVLSDKRNLVELHKGSYPEFISFFSNACEVRKDIINSFRQKPMKAKHCDVLFFPHKTYHTVTMLPIARELCSLGFSCAFVDMSKTYGDEHAYRDFDRSEFGV